MKWLYENRNKHGLWDFSSRISKNHYFPLSDDWRGKNRELDFSTCVLALLNKFVA